MSWQRKLSPILYVCWVVLFSFGVYKFNFYLTSLHFTHVALEATALQLENTAHDIRNVLKETHNQTNELMAFQSILNYLPQTEAHARSQKAVMDEVQSLRRKISRRLKGRVHILVDTKANVLYLKEGLKLLFQTDCSAGRGGVFYDKKSGRRWDFVTPQGRFRILGKNEKPVWIKPDWAFSEEGQVPPPPNDPKRRVEGELGEYLLNLGNGYLIHGTKHEDLLGRPASHGCIRLGSVPLKDLYEKTPVGTEVYIY